MHSPSNLHPLTKILQQIHSSTLTRIMEDLQGGPSVGGGDPKTSLPRLGMIRWQLSTKQPRILRKEKHWFTNQDWDPDRLVVTRSLECTLGSTFQLV